MSYDLAVFDADIAPKTRTEFMEWYRQQTAWDESHGYNNPEIPSPRLRSWFQEMIKDFPPLNGPLASDDCDDPRVTDYSLGRSIIYGAFAWSQADVAFQVTHQLAFKYRIGFFEVSANPGGIWTPTSDGKYVSMS
ncbi:hypothetical protein LOC68_05040 [Blastopirellula sp. JC732]|uniref:Uncharacterized protein n=1 Tax=Blastopirellula sediminis TaxID=2894196 RepID=A0A9X1MJM0_9BACT|nr:hypothetical protein [Blastopirellula sediminis]MCC9609472.1 hypothetical protein [Blastopirellula sediminis]MCC9627751.1 hypothetical protein [Blastopirellula sediminis]